MSHLLFGNIISAVVPPHSEEHIILPDGYSIYSLISTSNFSLENKGLCPLQGGSIEYKFPIVNGKSPCEIYIPNATDKGIMSAITITQFGGEPDLHYFDKAFEPILVKRKDGTEYNLIPTRNKGGV